MTMSWYQLHTWQMKARDIIESLYDRFIGAAEMADDDTDLKLLKKATAIFEDFGGIKAKTEYDSLKQENERLKERCNKIAAVLKRTMRTKKIKGQGKNEEYSIRQPQAWINAFAIIAPQGGENNTQAPVREKKEIK